MPFPTVQEGAQPGIAVLSFANLSFDVEEFAKRDKAHAVGERHIAGLMLREANNLQLLSLNVQIIYKRITELELGPDLGDQTLRWNGIFDTNVVLQYQDFWTIDWLKITEQPNNFFITLWASSALLSEIDEQQYYGRNSRVSRKARTFARWLNGQVKSATDIDQGIVLQPRLLLRFLTIPMGDVSPDTRHLEAAQTLRDRAVRVTVISHDTLMRLRAIQAGFPVFDLPDDLLDEKDSSSKPA